MTGGQQAMLVERHRNNRPRQLACYALKNLTPLSLQAIGDLLGMSWQAVANTVWRMKRRPERWRSDWEQLQKRLTHMMHDDRT